MATLSYHEQKDIENIKKLRELQKELPSFCSDFFRGIETSTSTRTRIAYAYDLKIFFQFLKTANPGTFDNPSHMDEGVLAPGHPYGNPVTGLYHVIVGHAAADQGNDLVHGRSPLHKKISGQNWALRKKHKAKNEN